MNTVILVKLGETNQIDGLTTVKSVRLFMFGYEDDLKEGFATERCELKEKIKVLLAEIESLSKRLDNAKKLLDEQEKKWVASIQPG